MGFFQDYKILISTTTITCTHVNPRQCNFTFSLQEKSPTGRRILQKKL